MRGRNGRSAVSIKKETLSPYLILTVLIILLLSACTALDKTLDKIMGSPPIYDYYDGFIDKTGKIIIEPKFEFVGNFSEGLAAARVTLYEDEGYIDRTGNFVIEPLFRKAWPFSEGLARVAFRRPRS